MFSRYAAARASHQLVISAALVISACGPGDKGQGFVGAEHPPVPAQAERLAGALITSVPSASGPEYALTHLRIDSGERVWLDSLIGRGEQGRQARWRVVGELELPVVPESHTVVIHLCRVRGVADHGLVAIARQDTARILTSVWRAWRADLSARRFRELAPADVSCENEGYSL
jgi:hypothetical protein